MRSTHRCSALLRSVRGCGSGCRWMRRRSIIRGQQPEQGMSHRRGKSSDARVHPKRGQQVRGHIHRSILHGAPLASVPSIQAEHAEHPAALATRPAPPSRSPAIGMPEALKAPLAPPYMLPAAPRHKQRTEAVRRGGEEERREVRKNGAGPRRAARRRWRRGGAARHDREARRMARGTTALRGTTAPRGTTAAPRGTRTV